MVKHVCRRDGLVSDETAPDFVVVYNDFADTTALVRGQLTVTLEQYNNEIVLITYKVTERDGRVAELFTSITSANIVDVVNVPVYKRSTLFPDGDYHRLMPTIDAAVRELFSGNVGP